MGVFGLVLFDFESWFSTAQADLLHPSPKNWNYRFAPPDPASFVMILEIVLFTESHIYLPVWGFGFLFVVRVGCLQDQAFFWPG